MWSYFYGAFSIIYVCAQNSHYYYTVGKENCIRALQVLSLYLYTLINKYDIFCI